MPVAPVLLAVESTMYQRFKRLAPFRYVKVALLADLHLGFGYSQHSADPCREDSFRNAEAAMKLAADQADIILVAGDIFDRPRFGTELFMRALDIFDVPRRYPSLLWHACCGNQGKPRRGRRSEFASRSSFRACAPYWRGLDSKQAPGRSFGVLR